jgi:hypothetical protein
VSMSAVDARSAAEVFDCDADSRVDLRGTVQLTGNRRATVRYRWLRGTAELARGTLTLAPAERRDLSYVATRGAADPGPAEFSLVVDAPATRVSAIDAQCRHG